jgi:hypothetical protein
MDQVKFLETVGVSRRLAEMARAIPDADMAEAIVAAERADTLGPVFDPTLWRAAGDDLHAMIRDLRALAEYRRSVH